MTSAGFRGWLLVLAIFQILLLCREAVLLLGVAHIFIAGQPAAGIGAFSLVYGGRLALNLAFLALLVVAIVLMVQRRRSFVRWGQIEMKCLMALPLVEYGWIVAAPWPGRAGISLAVILLMVVHLAVGVVWARYIETSKRVAATFVR